jgi:hypothetical protein
MTSLRTCFVLFVLLGASAPAAAQDAIPSVESAGWWLLRAKVTGGTTEQVMAAVGRLRSRAPESHRPMFDAGVQELAREVSHEAVRIRMAFPGSGTEGNARALSQATVEVYRGLKVCEILHLGHAALLRVPPQPEWARQHTPSSPAPSPPFRRTGC